MKNFQFIAKLFKGFFIMRCPFCGHDDETQVKDSRPSDDNNSIRRRRQCPACAARFTTFERVQLRDLMVIKKDDSRVVFEERNY